MAGGVVVEHKRDPSKITRLHHLIADETPPTARDSSEVVRHEMGAVILAAVTADSVGTCAVR